MASKVKPKVDEQYRLLDVDQIKDQKTGNGSAGFNDPAFARNKMLPVHRWVPWIAGFASEFVGETFNRYLSTKGTILDPFSGVGTTLVEALMAGHDAIGFEINPFAALACRVKTNAYRLDEKALSKALIEFRRFFGKATATKYCPKTSPPEGFHTRASFYSPDVLYKVLIIQDFIESIEVKEVQELFRLAFASTMVRYSNYSYEPSLGRRVTAGKSEILDFPVAETIAGKLSEMIEDIAWTKSHGPIGERSARIFNQSFFTCQDVLPSACIDLVVTSPPYLNNYHYNRNTRPQLYWLGYASKPRDFKALEEANFGKYWQTVREQSRLDLIPALQDTPIAERLEQLRQLNNERGIYGGNGWANYAASYFNDCYTFAQALQYALKPGATALIVIGNSILQGVLIPTDQYLAHIAARVGLDLVRMILHVVRELATASFNQTSGLPRPMIRTNCMNRLWN